MCYVSFRFFICHSDVTVIHHSVTSVKVILLACHRGGHHCYHHDHIIANTEVTTATTKETTTTTKETTATNKETSAAIEEATSTTIKKTYM